MKKRKIINPLIKRVPKELLGEWRKYLVIFLLLSMTIGFVSGFLVADGSMIKTYNDSFSKYNIENGHFITSLKLTDKAIENIEDEDVELCELFYKDKQTDNDYRYIDIYDLNSEEAKKLGTVNAGVDRSREPLDPKELKLEIRCNLLSSYGVKQFYKLYENGELKPEGEFAYIELEPNALRLKETIDAKMLDDEEGSSMHDVTLGSQTELKFYRTDLDSIVDLKLNDDSIIRLKIESNGGDYGQTIDGVPIEDIFEGVFFAG